MIDISTRLRRAIHLNDLALFKRILSHNAEQSHLQNPDHADRSNTSLHLASSLGHLDIVRLLVELGHEDGGISRNAEYETPLMAAAENKRTDVARYLVGVFPRCLTWRDAKGQDALMMAAKVGAIEIMELLLSPPRLAVKQIGGSAASTIRGGIIIPYTDTADGTDLPADPNAHDNEGNTALHHASAAGELKALRILLSHGASPLAVNHFNWTPVAYSATTQAETYFKQLVAEFDKRRVLQAERDRKNKIGGGGGPVRLVTTASSLAGDNQEAPLPPVPGEIGVAVPLSEEGGGRPSYESTSSFAGRPSYDNRPSYDQNSSRPSYDQSSSRPSYDQNSSRPSYDTSRPSHDHPRPSYDSANNRSTTATSPPLTSPISDVPGHRGGIIVRNGNDSFGSGVAAAGAYLQSGSREREGSRERGDGVVGRNVVANDGRRNWVAMGGGGGGGRTRAKSED